MAVVGLGSTGPDAMNRLGRRIPAPYDNHQSTGRRREPSACQTPPESRIGFQLDTTTLGWNTGPAVDVSAHHAPMAGGVWFLNWLAPELKKGHAVILFWRRTDLDGLERMTLVVRQDGVQANSTVVCIEDGGFRLDHTWQLTSDWQAVSLQVERVGADGRRVLALERDGNGWRVDGQRRPDLDGTDEPDLSVTPFSNTLPIRRLVGSSNSNLTLDVAYVSGKDLTVTRSRQRYERRGPGVVRFVDLGVSAGFEADLAVDEHGLVLRYQHLFERVAIRT